MLSNATQKMMESNYSFGIERDVEQLKANNLDFRKWTNPLEVQCVELCPMHPRISLISPPDFRTLPR